jgi:hypothetical protein
VTIVVIGISIYSSKDFYQQAWNQLLINNGYKKREANILDISKLDTSKMQNYSTDFYVIYYPQNYILSFLNDSLIFYKDLDQIAKLKIINLKSDKFEDFEKISGNYFFSQNINFDDPMNIPEFFNKYLAVFQNDLIKPGDTFYVAHEEYNSSPNELNFKKYTASLYTLTNQYKFIMLTDSEDILKNIILLSDGEILIAGYLTMPSTEELNYFIGIIPFVNRQFIQ